MIAMQEPSASPPVSGSDTSPGADPRLKLALELAARYRDIQLATFTHLRDRSLALLEIIFLGAAIVFAFGSSGHKGLRIWMVVLLLVALAYNMAAVYYISLPSKWQTTDWAIPWKGQQEKCSCTVECSCGSCKAPCPCSPRTINECMDALLGDVKAGTAKNDKVLLWKRRAFVSMFWTLAILIALAVIFWVTLGT